MKQVAVAAIGAAALSAAGCIAAPTPMDISNCAELQAAAEATATVGNVLGQLVEEEIFCDEWLNVEIPENKLKLDGDDGVTYKFDKVRFVVKSGAVLRVEVPVEFTGDRTQVVHGGVLNVEEGGKARFLSSVSMDGIGVDTVDLADMKHGGCVYNQGYVRFEGEFYANGCETVSTIDEYRVAMAGNGAGIWNGKDAKVVFKEAVEMDFCGNWPWTSNGAEPGADGGAIYSDGEVSFFEDALFTNNEADEGGALWIGVTGVVKFLKSAKATFQSNSGPGNGGTINNYGVLVMRNTASFNQGRSTDGSGGCISCGPASEMVFVKNVLFDGCQSTEHGAAIYIDYDNVEFLPEDATYTDNFIVNNSDGFFKCEDVYVVGDGSGDEDAYMCLP
ncbi:unnamed protein product [Ectocarpus sp. 4 AP-2014]